ncbi:MAG TPA: tetratricopeptide repeat protein, partial [Candidatus Xenobia bacterium]
RPDDIEALLIQGDLLSQLNRWEDAVGVFNRVLRLDSSRPDIRRRLTDYYFSVGKLEQATAEIKALTEVLQNQGRFLEAELLFRRLLAYYPDSVEIRTHILGLKVAQQDRDKAVRECLLLANLFLQQQHTDHALAILHKVLEFDPDNLNARHRIANLAKVQGRTDMALAQHEHLAGYYSKNNLTKQALKCLEEIIALKPDDIEHRQMLIEMLVKQVRIEEATEQYKLLLRGYLRDGQTESASRCVQEILELQPLHSDLRLQLAEIYLEGHHLQDGLALMNDLVAVYLSKKQYHRVLNVYQRIADVLRQEGLVAEHWEVREKMAELSVQEGKLERAIQEYQDILEGLLRGDHMEAAARVYDRLGHFYVKEDQIPAGVKALGDMVERCNQDHLARQANFLQDRIVDLLEKQGTLEAALSMLLSAARRYEEADHIDEAISTHKRAADLMLKQEQTEAAMREFHRIVELKLLQGDAEGAQAIYDEASPYASSPVAWKIRFADQLFGHHDYERALPIYVEAQSLAEEEDLKLTARVGLLYAIQGNLEGFNQYANRLFATGQLGWIVDTYKQATGFKADDPQARLKLGQFYRALGFEEEAVSEFHRASQDPETMLPAYQAMATSFKEQGMLELAIRTHQRIIDKFPEDETLDLRYDLASMYQDAGRLDDALTTFQDVYATDISFRDVADRITQVEGLLG